MGFRAATTRAIAADAGVDAALINYFFGSKQNLFGQAFALRANPAVVIAEALDGPIDELPRNLLTVLLDTWEVAENRATLLAVAQAGAVPETAALTRGFVEGVLMEPVRQRLHAAGVGRGDAKQCSALIATQLVGVVYARYVVEVTGVASMPAKRFLDGYLPAIERIFEDCLGRARR